MSQIDVASATGLGLPIVRECEAGRYGKRTLRSLLRIAKALGCAPTDLVPGLARRIRQEEGDERS